VHVFSLSAVVKTLVLVAGQIKTCHEIWRVTQVAPVTKLQHLDVCLSNAEDAVSIAMEEEIGEILDEHR